MADSAGGIPQFVYPATGGSTGSGTSSSSSQQSTQVLPQLAGYYQQLLGMNQANYGQMLNAYNTGQGRLAGALPSVYQGYGNLSGNVMNTLGMGQVLGANGNWGVAAPAAEAIENTEQSQEQKNQALATTQGLGNTTAVQNLNAQAGSQAEFGYGNLGSQLAGQAAGYQSQIGQAGLGAQLQGLGMQTSLTQGALSNLEQPYSNTFGGLTGAFGNSTSSSRQAQQSQNQGGSGGGNAPTSAGGIAGLGNGATPPASAYGNSALAGMGAGGGAGAGVAGTSGYGAGGGQQIMSPVSSTGDQNLSAYGTPPASPGGIGTYNFPGAASTYGSLTGAMQGAGLGSGLGGALGALGGAYAASAGSQAGGLGSSASNQMDTTSMQNASNLPGISSTDAQTLSQDNAANQKAGGEGFVDPNTGQVVYANPSNGMSKVWVPTKGGIPGGLVDVNPSEAGWNSISSKPSQAAAGG